MPDAEATAPDAPRDVAVAIDATTDAGAPDVTSDVPRDVFVDGPPVCLDNTADCDGLPGNGCEVTLRNNRDHCGACGVRCCGACVDGQCWADGLGLTVCARGPDGCRSFPRNLATDPAACGRCENACGQGEVCQSGVCTAPASCLAILTAGRSVGDGVYNITLLGARVQVRCLMSADGGGWTQVMNYPAGTVPTAVPTWNSGNAVGNAFGDLTGPWRLSDAQINALRTGAYRARGSATRCLGGPCALDHTLYWRGDCAFSSASSSAACATAFVDPAFAMPTGNTLPCAWHVGLTDTRCGARGGIITNHTTNGIVVCTGDPRSFEHACSARGNEDPGLAVWVR